MITIFKEAEGEVSPQETASNRAAIPSVSYANAI
jgi:hypothetical protein